MMPREGAAYYELSVVESRSERGVEAAKPVRPEAMSTLLKEMYAAGDDASERQWVRPLPPGSVVGRFELVREIGQGGFGIVYEARDLELGRSVAFKALRPGERPDVRDERLLREAEAAARLAHPNIVTIYDVGRAASGPYLILELLQGQTLAQRLQLGPVPTHEALRIAVAIAEGLAHAHSHGVVHRDLTPGNVFLCDDGRVKLLDLGMAHAFGRRKLEGGTPAYMAPEQVRGAPEDERTDVFALGVMLYVMVSGKLPFETAGAKRRRLPTIKLPGEPEFSAALARMLAIDPVRRPRDGAEVLAALMALHDKPTRSTAAGRVAVDEGSRRSRGTGWAATKRTLRKAVAVLPFTDLSPGKDQEYFSDGIADEILNELGHVPGLMVAGRTSSFSFKGKNEDLRSIGRKLNVGAVLEGSVRRAGDRVRISAQLVDAQDGYHIWSGSFDRELTDIFAVQDEIASAVVAAMKLTLLSRKAAQKRAPSHPEAYADYLLGRHLFNLGTPEDYRRAVAAFERAVAIDGSYAPAWAWLSTALLNDSWSRAETNEESMRRALAASERAVALDPDLAECYSARGWMRMAVSWDWTGAQADLERAIHDNPRDATILVRIGNVNAILGHLSDAIAITKRAREIDPMYSLAWYFLALYHNFGGRPDIARDAATRALEISPRHAYALRELGNANLLARDPASALAVFRSHPSDAIRLAGIAMAQWSLGNEEQAARAFDALRGRCATSDAYPIALVHAWRGEVDASYEHLERSLPQKNMRLRYIKLDPLLANIRGDPRYEAVLRRMGLPID